MSTRSVLAIDFGTSNTYYCRCSGDKLDPEGVDCGGGGDGLASAVLYRTGKSPLVGNRAVQEYGEATPDERALYRLEMRFKPDIVSSTEAAKAAQDFLAGVLEEARAQHVHISPQDHEVIVGVPSEAGPEFCSKLSEIAAAAGYGTIRTVDEPRGALHHHLHLNELGAPEALDGVLAIDFGGGTCDFAYMFRGEVRHSWGDMGLGGRLFDDLFFQWFVETNPLAAEKMRQEHAEYYVHAVVCRETKELFSRTMSRDRSEQVSKSLAPYGRLNGMCWAEFIERAQSYRPSNLIEKECATAPREPADLIEWFHRTLRTPLDRQLVNQNDIKHVILCGGSSQWPFVSDIVRDVLGLPDGTNTIRRSSRPYAAIAHGLAVLPAWCRMFEANAKKLNKSREEFERKKLSPEVRRIAEQVCSGVAEAVTRELFDGRVRSILLSFREDGGSIKDLKERLVAAVDACGPRVREIVDCEVQQGGEALAEVANERLVEWFRTYDIAAPRPFDGVAGSSRPIDNMGVEAPDVYGPIGTAVAAILTALGATIMASICGGGGLALIMPGPLGLLIGALIGLVAAGLVAKYGVQEAKRKAEAVPVWKPLRNMVFTDKKLMKLRTHMQKDVMSKLHEVVAEMQKSLEKTVKEEVDRQLDALNEICQLPARPGTVPPFRP